MRRSISHFVQKTIDQNDPYNIGVTVWDSTLLTFRLYADAELGNDDNDGLTWATAKKTLAGVQALIPFDLKGMHILIFFHPGTYTSQTAVNFYHINGEIKFVWVGEYINTAQTPYAAWVRNGAVNPIRSSNQVIWHFVNCNLALHSSGRSCHYVLCQFDFSKGYSQAGYCYWDRFVIKQEGTSKIHSSNAYLCFDSGYTLDETLRTGSANPFEITNTYLFHNAVKIIGANTGKSQGVGTWDGFYYCGANSETEIKYAQLGFAEGFAPTGNIQYEITNYKQLVTSGTSVPVKHNINIPTDKITFDPGVTGLTYPRVYLGTSAYGAVSLNLSQVTLADFSIQPRTITDHATGITNNYLSNDLKTISGNILLSANNSLPDDSLLSNKNILFWIDEVNNKLMVKLKYSNGTVKTSEVALT